MTITWADLNFKPINLWNFPMNNKDASAHDKAIDYLLNKASNKENDAGAHYRFSYKRINLDPFPKFLTSKCFNF